VDYEAHALPDQLRIQRQAFFVAVCWMQDAHVFSEAGHVQRINHGVCCLQSRRAEFPQRYRRVLSMGQIYPGHEPKEPKVVDPEDDLPLSCVHKLPQRANSSNSRCFAQVSSRFIDVLSTTKSTSLEMAGLFDFFSAEARKEREEQRQREIEEQERRQRLIIERRRNPEKMEEYEAKIRVRRALRMKGDDKAAELVELFDKEADYEP